MDRAPRAHRSAASTPTSTATPRARPGMTASEIRALFAVASPPRGGLAGRRHAQHLRPAARRRRPRDRATWSPTTAPIAMQYGSGQGVPELREQITEVMRLEGIEAHPDDVVVTVGSQQAVDLVTRVFCDPGDVVICEAPSYVGALGVFKAYQCDVVHAEMDADGLVPEALRQAIAAVQAAGQDDQVPLHDPELPQPGRRDARPASAAPRSSRSAAPRTSWSSRTTPTACSASTASRCARCAPTRPRASSTSARSPRPSRPGFRVGWALAPHAVREKLVLAQESATLCPPQFSPDGGLGLPLQPRLAGPDQAVPGDVPRAPRRDGRARCTT